MTWVGFKVLGLGFRVFRVFRVFGVFRVLGFFRALRGCLPDCLPTKDHRQGGCIAGPLGVSLVLYA